jgi:hypothetical protein
MIKALGKVGGDVTEAKPLTEDQTWVAGLSAFRYDHT